MDVPYFIIEHPWINASDEATLKITFGGNTPSSKLNLQTKWYHGGGCCDDSQSCEQLVSTWCICLTEIMEYFKCSTMLWLLLDPTWKRNLLARVGWALQA